MHEVRLVACDERSNATYSELVCVESAADLRVRLAEFETAVPFTKWFSSHEYDGDNVEILAALEEAD